MEHHLHGSGEHEPIPGERDPDTLTHREPGAIGAGFAGEGTPPDPHTWVGEKTAHDRELEGGGEQGARPKAKA